MSCTYNIQPVNNDVTLYPTRSNFSVTTKLFMNTLNSCRKTTPWSLLTENTELSHFTMKTNLLYQLHNTSIVITGSPAHSGTLHRRRFCYCSVCTKCPHTHRQNISRHTQQIQLTIQKTSSPWAVTLSWQRRKLRGEMSESKCRITSLYVEQLRFVPPWLTHRHTQRSLD